LGISRSVIYPSLHPLWQSENATNCGSGVNLTLTRSYYSHKMQVLPKNRKRPRDGCLVACCDQALFRQGSSNLLLRADAINEKVRVGEKRVFLERGRETLPDFIATSADENLLRMFYSV
jgi:hypothetical protein